MHLTHSDYSVHLHFIPAYVHTVSLGIHFYNLTKRRKNGEG